MSWCLAALSVGLGRVCGLANVERATARLYRSDLSHIEGLAGNDSVDFCTAVSTTLSCKRLQHLPVRIFWNANSTFVASSAEVSMKERWFSAAKFFASSVGTALKCL